MFFGSSTSFYASAKLSAAEAITGHHVPLTCANIGIFLLSTNNDWKRPIRRPSHTWLRAIEAPTDELITFLAKPYQEQG